MSSTKLLTSREVANLLRVSVMTITNYVRGSYIGIDGCVHQYNNDFPKPLRIGRAFKFKESEINRWINTRAVA